MCELNWEEDKVYLYNDYLMFIRRKMNYELDFKLSEGELMDIEIDDIKTDRKKTNIWKFLCILVDKTKRFPQSQNTTYIYEAIGFHDWLKMLKREQKLKDLGL